MNENERLHPSAPEDLPEAEHKKAVELAKQQHPAPGENEQAEGAVPNEELPNVRSDDV